MIKIFFIIILTGYGSGVIFPSPAHADLLSWVKQWLAADTTQALDEDDDDDESAAVYTPMQVQLADESLEYAGLMTTPLMLSFYQPEAYARVEVVDIQELLTLRSQLHQLKTQLELATVRQQNQQQERNRLKNLAEQTGRVANKEVQHAEALVVQLQAERASIKVQVEDHQTLIKQRWAMPIADWIMAQQSAEWSALLARQKHLLKVSAVDLQSTILDVATIQIAKFQADESVAAQYVAPVLTAGPQMLGEASYYLTQLQPLRSGQRLEAWVPQSKSAAEGLLIPASAIVWYAGDPWCYIALEDNLFKRVSLESSQDTPSGRFVEVGALQADDELVISGAQTLLSEEFKWQIVDEDDDD